MKKLTALLLCTLVASSCTTIRKSTDQGPTKTPVREVSVTPALVYTQTQIPSPSPFATQEYFPPVTPSPTSFPGRVVVYNAKEWVSYTHLNTNDGLVRGMVYDIAMAPDGTLWFATPIGVSHFDGETWTAYTRGNGLIDSVANAVAITADGIVWVGTEDGVSRYDGETWQTFTTDDGLSGNYICSIATTTDAALWIGDRW